MATQVKEELMPQIYEEWIVVIGKESFTLNKKQMDIIREANTSGNRGIVFFDKFAISIPHIQCAYLTKRYKENDNKQISEHSVVKERNLAPEDLSVKIKEAKKRLGL